MKNISSDRKILSIFNGTDTIYYIKLGTKAASSIDYTVRIPPNFLYETPMPVWDGAIQAIAGSSGTSGVITVTDQS